MSRLLRTSQISGTLDRIFSAAPVDVKKDVEEIAKRKLVFDLAENVITILWCLRLAKATAYHSVTHELTCIPPSPVKRLSEP
jgi:hypothetical protein